MNNYKQIIEEIKGLEKEYTTEIILWHDDWYPDISHGMNIDNLELFLQGLEQKPYVDYIEKWEIKTEESKWYLSNLVWAKIKKIIYKDPEYNDDVSKKQIEVSLYYIPTEIQWSSTEPWEQIIRLFIK